MKELQRRSHDKNHCNCPVPLEKFYTNNVIEDELFKKQKKKEKITKLKKNPSTESNGIFSHDIKK